MTLLTKLTEYSISQRLGQIEESAAVKTKDFSTIFSPDQDVEINVAGGQRKFFISKARRDIKLNDIEQSLECVSPMAKNAKSAHAKAITYTTMTRQEYKDFRESVPSFSLLDYLPLIRFGDDFGVGGWSMQGIIFSLAGLMGVTVNCLLPDYWIKQFSVSLGEPYWQAILGLVSPLKPQIFSVGGQIFIVGDIGAIDLVSSNVLSPNARLVSEEIARPENPFLLKVGGDLGVFRPDRYKGKINTHYQSFEKDFGNVRANFQAYGYEEKTSESETGDPLDNDIDLETGIFAGYTKEITRQGYGLDAFGKRAFEVGENRDFYKFKGDIFVNSEGKNQWSGTKWLVLFRRESKANSLKNTHLRYLAPIETSREEVVDSMVWFMPDGVSVKFDFYNKLKEKKTNFIYSEESLSKGSLLTQAINEQGMTYTEDEQEFKPLEIMQKDDITSSGLIQKKTTLSETINYTQHTKDSYGVRRVATFLGADGKFKTESELQVVQAGAIQGEREQYRKMPVYAEATIGGDAPSIEKRISTPSWVSIELLTAYLAMLEGSKEIYRTYEIPDELDVHLGLQVAMGVVTHPGNGDQIPAPSLATGFKPVIVAYEIKNNLYRKSTTITVRGRLS